MKILSSVLNFLNFAGPQESWHLAWARSAGLRMTREAPTLELFIQQRFLSVCCELRTVVRDSAGTGTDKSLSSWA